MQNLLGFAGEPLIRDLFEVMSEVLANRDLNTFKHTQRVAQIAVQLGRELGLTGKELELLELGCLVHDIGKTGIPDDVLLKPGLFTAQDRRIMEFHPLIGAKLFARRLNDDRITNIVLRHHERLDGSGYPFGLKGDEIDLYSRITAVADIFEAMTARRPYKVPISSRHAMLVLEQEVQDGLLDANVVAALAQILPGLELHELTLYPTGGFMEEVEKFRQATFFRDALSELYNYRYLLVLDDLGVLGEGADGGYLLSLISFSNLGHFQADKGVIVAGQVHDEIGQRLADVIGRFAVECQQYESSIMLFRKHCDYMIYAEAASEEELEEFRDGIRQVLEQTYEEWGLEPHCYRLWFKRSVAMEQAMTTVFTLKDEQAESCITESGDDD